MKDKLPLTHAAHAKWKKGSPKMLDKHIRKAMKMVSPPRNPFAALMHPMVIVPEDHEEKVVIADAGSIVFLCDQRVMYRERISPITRRADEILVQYGKASEPKFGWLTHKLDPKSMKPSTGPTFLVRKKDEDAVSAWERVRLMVGRSRKNDPTNWVAPWLATHGGKHQKTLREVTREFGGKPKKGEGTEARCVRLFSLILHTELDMATAKSSKSKKSTKKGKSTKSSKTSKKTAAKKSAGKKKSSADPLRITKKQNDYVIKTLVKENPRKAGTQKAKVWNKLKKGMTVAEFVKKGGSRSAVRRYVESGWVKLVRPGA